MRTRRSSKEDPDAATQPVADKKSAKKKKLPVVLYVPNLIGYVRVITLVMGAMAESPASNTAIWCLTISLVLDYIDGPAARYLNQCSQFGDLLDHYADHLTMMYLV